MALLQKNELEAARASTADQRTQGLDNCSTQIWASAPLGATVCRGGVGFSLFSRKASVVELLLFDREDDARPARVIVTTFKGSSAALTLEPSPKFCISVPANIDPTAVMIGSIAVKKDHRELETCAGPCASRGRNSDDWMPQKNVRAVDVKRVSDTTVEITPKAPLSPGQYILGGSPLIGYYDFAVAER
jgi:hypothetical protein